MVVSIPYESDPYIAVGIFFGVLEVLAVAGRMYVRGYMIRAFGIDDVACLVTMIVALAYGICLIALWRITDLRPIPEVPAPNVIPGVRLVLSSLLTYILGTMLLKVSLGLLLLRVLARKSMVITIYITMGISVVYGVGYFFLVLFECGNPTSFPYDILQADCLSATTIDGVAYTHAALTSLADVIFGVLPVIYLWNAKLERRVKLSVGGILVLGSVGCICSFIRIGWVSNLTTATSTFLVTSRGIALMSAIELSIGLICISLATYKPLFKRYFRRGSRRGYTYGSRTAPGQSQEVTQNSKREKFASGHSGAASTFNEAQSMPTSPRDGKYHSGFSDTTATTHTTFGGKEPLTPKLPTFKPGNVAVGSEEV